MYERALHENAEVVGTDEAFFEDEDKRAILDLYNETTGILDGDDETDVDLSSYAYQDLEERNGGRLVFEEEDRRHAVRRLFLKGL